MRRNIRHCVALNTPPSSVGEEVRRVREQLGHSQRDFANLLGVTYQYMSDIELERRRIGFRMCGLLAGVSNTSPLYWAERQFAVDYWKHFKGSPPHP